MDCLYLIRCGVPYEVAFGLDESERMAFVVVLGELEGWRFDWTTLQWREG